MRNWIIFIQERFSPLSYIPMIGLFTIANGLYLSEVTQSSIRGLNIICALALMFSFFFRMRLFDEIKDYEVDLKVNPTRPLARGLLKVSAVKKALFLLILLELILAAYLGLSTFLVHALALGYSLLMFEEFFIGDFLRPHLTTYAVTHTFVSVLLGLSAATAITDFNIFNLQSSFWAFFLMNWCFFNLFEFARKTFHASEERQDVPSYSNIFGPWLAWGLSVSQAALGVLIVSQVYASRIFFILLGLYLLVSLSLVLKKSKLTAKVFRAASGAYLLLHYAALIYVIGVH